MSSHGGASGGGGAAGIDGSGDAGAQPVDCLDAGVDARAIDLCDEDAGTVR
jgi:hypothetical protein